MGDKKLCYNKHMRNKKVRTGFTLVELSLSIAVEIVDDMRASIQNAPARSVKNECNGVYEEGDALKRCEEDGGRNFVVVTKNSTVKIGNNTIDNTPIYGALCTGGYSYIWKSGYYYSEETNKCLKHCSPLLCCFCIISQCGGSPVPGSPCPDLSADTVSSYPLRSKRI